MNWHYEVFAKQLVSKSARWPSIHVHYNRTPLLAEQSVLSLVSKREYPTTHTG